jgi:hypothetical protein
MDELQRSNGELNIALVNRGRNLVRRNYLFRNKGGE